MGIGVVFQQMIILMLMVLIGFIVGAKRIFEEQATMNFATLINYVAIPAMIIGATGNAGDSGSKADSLLILLLAILLYFILFLMSLLTPKILRVSADEVGMMQFLTVFSNVGFMGFAVIFSIFGDAGLFYASIFNIPNGLLIFSLGIYLLTKGEGGNDFNFRKLLFMPANIAAILSLVLFLFDITLPETIVSTAASVGSITTPLAMILIGMAMVKIDIVAALKDVKMYLFSFVRMLGLPVLIYFLFRPLVSNQLMLGVIVILAAMPGPSMAVTLSTQYGGNTEFATKYVFISTILSGITIPLISLLIT